MKKYYILSGLNLYDNNRGTAALGFGSFTFLKEKGHINNENILLDIKYVRYPWQLKKSVVESLNIQGEIFKKETRYILSIHNRIRRKFGIIIPFLKLHRTLKEVSFIAALNGGDGFSDIYNKDTFLFRLPETILAIQAKLPVIQLPQTIGPFTNQENYNLAKEILLYSKKVYVRDEKFTDELKKMGVNYELTKDLSAYMKPEPWCVEIKPNSIGLNISGLCYSNSFRSLSNQFSTYPELIDKLIEYFQSENKHIYLIPHSYNYFIPETSNDDLIVCREVYNKLKDKSNVTIIDKDLTSPQVKYVISKMSFFIGSRMHANFAAIYSNVPVFGFAYSYKFEGAFNSNGLDGKKQTYMINNMPVTEIESAITKVIEFYKSQIQN